MVPAARMGTSLRVFWRIHRAFLRLTGGRFGKVGPMDALLLATTGLKRGEPRAFLLNYIRPGHSFVVLPSYAGADPHPARWPNPTTGPGPEIPVGGEIRPVARA